MKTMTIEEFAALVRDAKIEIGSEWTHTDYQDDDDEGRERPNLEVLNVWNSIELDGLHVDCVTSAQHESYKPSTLEIFDDNADFHFLEMDFEVIDEDGDTLEQWQIEDILIEETNINDFSALESTLGADELEEIETGENDMETTIVKRDNDKDIKFCGEEIAAASSNTHSNFRWSELTLYKTKGGKFICQEIGVTCVDGETDRHSAEICETIDEVNAFFGNGWLAKELYDNAGFEIVEEVD